MSAASLLSADRVEKKSKIRVNTIKENGNY